MIVYIWPTTSDHPDYLALGTVSIKPFPELCSSLIKAPLRSTFTSRTLRYTLLIVAEA